MALSRNGSSADHLVMRNNVNVIVNTVGAAGGTAQPGGCDAGAEMTQAETAVMSAILVLVFLSSLVANAFVFVVFCKRKTLSMSNRFVANLTVCNCLNTLLVVPFAFSSLLTKQWVFGEVWCVCTGFLMNVVVSASIFTLAVISIDRYFAVVTPLHYSMRLTSRRCYGFIVCIWVLAILISAPPLLGWNSMQFQLHKMVCTVKWSSVSGSDRYYTFFMISFSFLLPLIAMLWTYARIFRAARGNIVRARRNSVIRGSSSAPCQSDENGQQQTTPINSRRRSSSVPIIRRLSQSSSRSSSLLWRKEEWKAAVTSFLVLFSFAVCWTPYFVVMGIEAGLGEESPLYPIVSHISTVLAMFSCACNPLVYVFRSKIVRRELKAIVQGGRGGGGHELCIPHELPRRASVVRNESGRSLRSMGDLEEDVEAERTEEEKLHSLVCKKSLVARTKAQEAALPCSDTCSTLLTCSSCNSMKD
ncbi:G-protein coupled receptor 161 [Aplysia californica]|uniref:G-protein coupled receptor 161 n=1 Tax=Aplysia californica TaxID=6500 RepID=A0ABM0JE11_APLCA|nr:G-protein coupled receptor 161 [Aplysia californica]